MDLFHFHFPPLFLHRDNQFSSITHFDTLQPHGLQHARLPWHANSRSLLTLMFIELEMPSNHLILCCPLLLQPSVFPSIRVFSSELALCIRGPQYWSFSFNISRSSEYSGLISFRIHWFSGTCNSWFQTLAVLPFQMIL